MRPPRVSESGSLLRGSGGYAQMRVRRMSAPAFRGNRSLQHGSTDQNAEPAVAQILEQNALLTPDFFYDTARCVSPIRKANSLWLQFNTARTMRIFAAKARRSIRMISARSAE
jgi:hypothetical protein